MPNLDVLLAQLRQERDRLNEAIAALERATGNQRMAGGGRRMLSPAARRRIAAAQRKRWAAFRKQKKAA